ncbi:dihydroxy-acid dehydratase [Microtetraspora malaysiensis]|uniref:dihydroxy-acid dehydratase n=1 Tax=Microtetraspora malaysiensis TaxID=161358 RepID=UPI003D8DEDEB
MELRDARGVDRGLTSYGDEGFSRFLRRAFLASAGYDDCDLNRPVVGIADTSGGFTTCHREMPQLVQAVARGVLEAGGLPVTFPAMSLPEILMSPTSMLFRNLAALETEELVRAQPMDAVVLVGGCDKTVPAQLMAAMSADVPAVQLVAGSMLTGTWRGTRLGACTDCRSMWAKHRAGELDADDIADVRGALATTGGTCMVMGTASTMACLSEALGMSPAGTATAPAPTGDRLRAGALSGRVAVEAARTERRPSSIVTPGALANAVTVLLALGGSTNAVIHLLAVARRAGLPFGLDDVARIASRVPLLVDCKPSGVGYMEDLHRAGGAPVLMKALEPLLDLDVPVIEGGTLRDRLAEVDPPAGWQTTIRTLDDPLGPTGALAVLRGNLAPDGAVIKVSAASPTLLRHEGTAVVFESPEDAARRIDDPDLPVTPDSVLVLRNAGPVGGGMPEAGSLPIPAKLARSGVRDMVRVSDARMSGTAYGTVVLHVSPEAAVGGPLALVRDGDPIRLDAAAGELSLLVDPAELARRQAEWTPPRPPARGWRRLHHDHVLQAHEGADFDVC